MKTRLLVTALTITLLTGSLSALQAAPEHKMSAAQMTEMCKTMGEEDCRVMMREMVKNKSLHKAMAEELSKDKDFRETYNSRVGNDAPHQERNPSTNPELFVPKK